MTGFARGRGLYRFQSQLLCILAVAWSVLATSSCLGDSSSTKFSTTGSYVASNPAPDYLTTTGLRNMEVTGGTAQPVRFYDRGKVVMDATMTIGASAAFYYRSTGWGCFYSVSGTSGVAPPSAARLPRGKALSTTTTAPALLWRSTRTDPPTITWHLAARRH